MVRKRRNSDTEATIRAKYVTLKPFLDERARRIWAATESRALGYGGDAMVAAATGMSRTTIRKGRQEVAAGDLQPGRIRRPGAGRPSIAQAQPGITQALEQLMEPLSHGDTPAPLRWTCQSQAQLAAALVRAGWRASPTTISRLLPTLGYQRYTMGTRRAGEAHPDPSTQFAYINAQADVCLQHRLPVLAVDTQKKEERGREGPHADHADTAADPDTTALLHDLPRDTDGQTRPYTICDLGPDAAEGSDDPDPYTPTFAVAALRRWWVELGRHRYPQAHAVFIVTDAGGHNGYRSRRWRRALQRWADDTGLRLHVSHCPPGTRKWHRIEHRLFCRRTWPGPDTAGRTFETVVDWIGPAPTATQADHTAPDPPTDVSATPALPHADAHDDWNYVLHPR